MKNDYHLQKRFMSDQIFSENYVFLIHYSSGSGNTILCLTKEEKNEQYKVKT